jgi:ABC-type glycerol-3-phosphate transport system permease component
MRDPLPYASPGTPSKIEIPIAQTAVPSPRKLSLSQPTIFALLLFYMVLVIFPMFWLFYSSLKGDRDIFLHPFQLPTPGHFHWDNFKNAWTGAHFDDFFLNSVVVTLSSVAVTTFLAAMTAYAVSRFRFPLSKPILFYFLAGLMIPLQLAIVPLFFQLKGMEFHGMNMLNSRVGLFVVYLAFGFPFSVFILAGFFKTLPASLHESAVLDGATEFEAFWHVMLPLARPGLITVAIFLFLGNWNEFFVAFITMSGRPPADSLHGLARFAAEPRTLPLGLANITIVSNYRSDWGMAFAGLVLMMLPTLIAYMFLQKHLTKGITAGAIKG